MTDNKDKLEATFRVLNICLADKVLELGISPYEFVVFLERCHRAALIAIAHMEKEARKYKK